MKALIILAGIYVVLEIARFIYDVFVIRNQKEVEKNILILEENLTIANKRIQERDEDLNKWRSAYMQLKYEFEEKIRGVILENARDHYTSTGAPGIDVYLTDENIRKIAKQVDELVTQNWSRHLMDAFKKGDEAGRDYMTTIYPKWRIAEVNCFMDTPCFLVKFRHDGGVYEDWDEVICTNRLMKGEEYIDIAELNHLPKAEQI